MNKFEDFLQEGQKIQIKRKYTENHPASTVGKTASVRNEVLKAMKDGIITEEEFTKIISKVSKSPKRWRTTNSKYFNVSEDGIKLSKWGLRILSELDIPELNVFPICEIEESKEDSKLAAKKLEEKLENNTIMKNTFLYESFADFTTSNGILNEALGSQLLARVLMGNKEGKYGKENLKQLAGGFYGLAKVALDKVSDEDMIVSNDPTKVFKEHGGPNHILFFISDNEKNNPYCPYNAGYGALKTVPGGGTLIAAMSGDKEFYTNDWSRYSRTLTKSFRKDGKKGSDDQVGVGHKYRGWSGTGLYNGKRIAEVSDRVVIINLDLIRQKYSTKQLRAARDEAKKGATAFINDKDFKKANADRYHQIIATKASKMPLDKMVSDAIDTLATQIKDGLAKGEKTRYDEVKIGQTAKGREVKLRDASNHMSNILDDYSRYCGYIRQGEDSEKRYGASESWYQREIRNYAKSIKDRIAKIEGFEYAW